MSRKARKYSSEFCKCAQALPTLPVVLLRAVMLSNPFAPPALENHDHCQKRMTQKPRLNLPFPTENFKAAIGLRGDVSPKPLNP